MKQSIMHKQRFGREKRIPKKLQASTIWGTPSPGFNSIKGLRRHTHRHPCKTRASIIGKHGSSRILLKPASPGTGIIAGAAVRSVMEQVGINNILTKRQGSKNTMNLVHATVSALFNLKDAVTIANKRGISLKKVFN